MNQRPLEDEFRSFADDPVSAVEGVLLVSRIIRPDTDSAWCRDELRRLAAQAGPVATPEELVESLRAIRFIGADQYYEVDNSSFEFVLRQRRGIPITLAMVIVGTGEVLAMAATGINFPGHFMATLNGQLFDPFIMQPIDAAGRRDWLAKGNASADEAFKSATPIDIALRMLNNLRNLAMSRGDPAGALELTDYQRLVAPDRLSVRIDRTELWMALGATDMARRELTEAISLAPSSTIRDQLEEKLQALGATRPTLH